MRRLLNVFQLTLAACVFFCAVPVFAQNNDDTIDWTDDYQKAIQESKRTHKPIFLEFRCEA